MNTRYKMPIKRNVMLAGFKKAEAEFLAAGFDAATAVQMARQRVTHYRLCAGASADDRAKLDPRAIGKLRQSKPEAAFSAAAISKAIERGGVL